MKTLKFYGSSDDLLLLEVNGKLVDEICSIKGPAIYRVSQGEQALLVVGLYSPAPVHNGCWVVGATLLNEGVPLPAWPMQMETGPASGYPDPQPYSTALVIEVPDDAIVSHFAPHEDDEEED